MAIATACANSAGMGLQKRVHLDEVGAPSRKYWRDPRWLAGLACIALASVLVLVNYSLLGQSRAAAMSSLTIVTNAIMAHYYLHEAFGGWDAAATLIISTGIVIAVVGGSSEGGQPQTTFDALLKGLDNTTVYATAGSIVALAITLQALILYLERRRATLHSHVAAQVECVSRALLAGIFSGSTGFFAKGVVVAISNPKSANGYVAIFIVGLPLAIFGQLKTLNNGLRAFDAVVIVPLYQAAVVICGVVYGMVFFGEGDTLTDRDEAVFAVGCALSVVGIALLTCKGSGKQATGGRSTEATGLLAAPEVVLGVERAASNASLLGVPLLHLEEAAEWAWGSELPGATSSRSGSPEPDSY